MVMNGRKRRHGTLFEAMSKAPIAAAPAQPRSLLNWKKTPSPSGPSVMVAEPLTEEQAAEAIAAQQAERERVEAEGRSRDEARAAKRAEKLALQAERKAMRQAMKAQRATQREELKRLRAERLSKEPFRGLSFDRGRLLMALSGPGLVVIAAVVCVAVMAAYTLGQRGSGQPAKGPSTVAALLKPNGEPLNSIGSTDDARPGEQSPSSGSAIRIPSAARGDIDDPEAMRLVTPPPAKQKSQAAANPKERLSIEDVKPVAPQRLNYLKVESFPINRETTLEKIRADVAHVQKFLGDRGVQTVAKRGQAAVFLFVEQGQPIGDANKKDREKLRKKIEALGKEYRRVGGLYEFIGCDYVSASHFNGYQPL